MTRESSSGPDLSLIIWVGRWGREYRSLVYMIAVILCSAKKDYVYVEVNCRVFWYSNRDCGQCK